MPPQISGYERLEEIGRGGYSVVYRAWDKRHRRMVAIKVLQGGFDERRRSQFERECEAMGLVSRHPGCVTVYDSGYTDDGAPYLVMEYMPGGSLQDRLDHEAVPWPEAIAIGVTLAGVLHTAHEAGILHRDVKPENVLVSEFSEHKLSDFGIARLEGRTLTRTGPSAFTPMHAAPEVIDGEAASVASDVYSLGSTVYSLIAGSAPFFRATDESPYALIPRVLWDDPPELSPSLAPADVSHALVRALAKRRTERPSSAAELGHLFQTAQEHAGEAKTPLILAAPDEVEPDPRPQAEIPTEPRRRRRRGRVPLLVGGVCLAVAALLVVRIAVSVVGNDDDPSGDRARPTPPPQSGPLVPRPTPRLTVEVGARPQALAVGEDSVWVTNRGSGTVSRIQPAASPPLVVGTMKVGGNPSGIAVGHGAIWVTNAGDGTVSRVNPRTNRVVRTIRVGKNPSDVAAGAGAVWVANTGDDTVSRIDPATNQADDIPVGTAPLRVTIGASYVWVTNFYDRSVSRIDPLGNDVQKIEVRRQPMGIVADDLGVWITHLEDDTVTYVDANGNADPARVIGVGDQPTALVIDQRGVWVTNAGSDSVSRIDTIANRVDATFKAGIQPYDIAVEGQYLWLTNFRNEGKVSRLSP